MRELMRQLDEFNSTWPWKQTFLYALLDGQTAAFLDLHFTVLTPSTIRPMRLPPARISLSQRRFGKGACLLIRVLNLGRQMARESRSLWVGLRPDSVPYSSFRDHRMAQGFPLSSIRLLLRSLWHFIAHSDSQARKILTLGYGTKSATRSCGNRNLRKRSNKCQQRNCCARRSVSRRTNGVSICGISSGRRFWSGSGTDLCQGMVPSGFPLRTHPTAPATMGAVDRARLSDLH